MPMRHLYVNETMFEISETKAKEFIKDGLLYECEEHDLHLTPDYKWNFLAVERLLLATSSE